MKFSPMSSDSIMGSNCNELGDWEENEEVKSVEISINSFPSIIPPQHAVEDVGKQTQVHWKQSHVSYNFGTCQNIIGFDFNAACF